VAIDYQALKTEIATDPKTLGYAGKSDYDISVLMNTPGLSAETIIRTWTPIEEVIAAVVRADFDALAAAGKTYLDTIVMRGTRVKTGDATLRSQLAALFPAGTPTRTNLTNLATKSATRGEVLFGENTNIGNADVAKARALP
jgi:hypothetical protein